MFTTSGRAEESKAGHCFQRLRSVMIARDRTTFEGHAALSCHAVCFAQTHFSVADLIGITPSMFFEEGKAWGRSRRIIAPSLNAHNVMDMLEVISTVRRQLVWLHVVLSEFHAVANVSSPPPFLSLSRFLLYLISTRLRTNEDEQMAERLCVKWSKLASAGERVDAVEDMSELEAW